MENKKAGILLHPTSFFGNYGCGDLGKGAYKVVDWIKKAGFSYIQMLPLGPTGYGDSPYQSFSAFAGNPYLISFDKLIDKGYMHSKDLSDYPEFEKSTVDFGMIYNTHFKILKSAYNNFKKNGIDTKFDDFNEKNEYWLNDYALFMAIKDQKKGVSWNNWEDVLKKRTNLNLIDKLKDDVVFYKFIQWQFEEQWLEFRDYVHSKNIKIIGDAPIFVSYDSADVWSNQDQFLLDGDCNPIVIAGVPPDYFSKTGQLWGNPHYNWKKMVKNDFIWWKNRIRHLLTHVDCIRIDHFRGFESYWEVKSGKETAIHGKWVKAPGEELFNSFKKEFGDLSQTLIAEDLGIITKEVRELKEKFELPGMKIFEFAPFKKGTFVDDKGKLQNNLKHMYLPDNYETNSIAYPGTHDNDTLHGWLDSLIDDEKQYLKDYLKIDSFDNFNLDVFKKQLDSKSKWVIITMQDLLFLPTYARFNFPGTTGTHNWSWRLKEDQLTADFADKIKKIIIKSERI